jgi:predicted  nucleic acid-binding Zn-ribbon protein
MHRKRLLAAALAALLVTSVVVPSAALAISVSHGAQTATRKAGMLLAAKLLMLKRRIALALDQRKTHFDEADSRLSSRISRVEHLAEKVGAAGGDVSAVKASLGDARKQLAQAEKLEAEAVAAFKAIPDASDRAKAFNDAKAIAAQSVQSLQQTRVHLLDAIAKLRSAIERLRASSTTSQLEAADVVG